jgi:type I restriction enzyme S subunit
MKVYPSYKDSGNGWIGNIPLNWDLVQLKFLSENHDSKRIPVKAEDRARMQGGYPYYGATGIIDYVNDYLFDGEYLLIGEDGAPFFLPEDVAFIANGKFWVNNHAHILKPKNGSIIRFLKHVLNSVDYKEYITGSTRDKLTQSELSRIILPVPSLPEQLAIANFLDRKTAQIDTLIEKKQRQIELLQKHRTALINQAVTKGLNPDAPMKDSGIEWLGEVPAHWRIARIKHISLNMISGPFGSSLTKDMYTKNGFRVYGQEQVIPADFTIGDYYRAQRCRARNNKSSLDKG